MVYTPEDAMLVSRHRKRYFVGRRYISKGVPICFAKVDRDGGVIYDNCKEPHEVNPADREEAAQWMASNFGLSQDEWYRRLWEWSTTST